MDIDTALRIFEEDTIKLCAKENIPESYRSKKVDIYNTIVDHISKTNKHNDELQLKLNKEIESRKFILYKYECVLMAVGIKSYYIKNLHFTPISHIEMLVKKANNFKYSNKFTPDDLYIGARNKYKVIIDQNIKTLFENPEKLNQIPDSEIDDFIENINHE